ncbi:8802_t:CDS:2 [Entrophospora sp. SA101]|nr:16538_t:CDS:2 [Entrophospora sp. SA101]CAJ0830012.1 8802_t:CDS:2 [Entrophospora sp. SA101]
MSMDAITLPLISSNHFKKRSDGGYEVYIYKSKTNQRELSGWKAKMINIA